MKRVFWTAMIAVVIGALVLPQAAEAGQKRLGRAVLHILKVGHGARMAGMGGAYVAIADDINTIFL